MDAGRCRCTHPGGAGRTVHARAKTGAGFTGSSCADARDGHTQREQFLAELDRALWPFVIAPGRVAFGCGWAAKA